MPEQVVHGRSRGRGDGLIRRLAGRGVRLRDAHLHLREGRQVLRDGIAEDDATFLDEHHGGDRHERLGHRVDAEDRVLPERRAASRIARADRVEIGDFSLAGDQRHRAGQLLLLDLAAQRLLDAGQAQGGEADLLGPSGRERLGMQRRAQQAERRGDAVRRRSSDA